MRAAFAERLPDAPAIPADYPRAVGIPLRRRDGTVRAVAWIDEADWPLVARYRWYLLEQKFRDGGHPRGRPTRYVYGYLTGSSRMFYLHRVILGLARGDGAQADHIDFDGLNNRRSNLRVVTPQQNSQHARANYGRTYKGVSKNPEQWDKAGQLKPLGPQVTDRPCSDKWRGGEVPTWWARSRELQSLIDQGRTLKQMGEHYGVTRERIRQVVAALGLRRTKCARGRVTDRPWSAQIQLPNGDTLQLGTFATAEAAALAYNAAATEHFGEYAVLNDVPGTVAKPGARAA